MHRKKEGKGFGRTVIVGLPEPFGEDDAEEMQSGVNRARGLNFAMSR